jgi:hypothetical protein
MKLPKCTTIMGLKGTKRSTNPGCGYHDEDKCTCPPYLYSFKNATGSAISCLGMCGREVDSDRLIFVISFELFRCSERLNLKRP